VKAFTLSSSLFYSALFPGETVKEFEKIEVAAIQIEDQVSPKK